jgi:hypothetical protein
MENQTENSISRLLWEALKGNALAIRFNMRMAKDIETKGREVLFVK